MGLEQPGHSGNCDSQYYLKIINYLGEQLQRSDIFVAAPAAEGKNAVGVVFLFVQHVQHFG